MQLSADKRTAKIRVDRRLDAAQVHQLILDLAALRARMEPAHSRSIELAGDTEVHIQDDPDLQLGQLADGRFRLYLRSWGLGWLVFNLHADKARAIGDYIRSRFGAGRDLVGQQTPRGGEPH